MADIIEEFGDGVLRVTLNQTDRGNALNEASIDKLTEIISSLAGNPSIKAMVLSGAGDRAFCTGADLSTGSSFQFDYARPQLRFAGLLRAARAATTPLIARINGHCMAGGMGLLALCDLAIAVDHAKLALPEVKVGVFPMMVISELQHLIGKRKLYELCLLGRPMTAAEAVSAGLVNVACPASELDRHVDGMLSEILEKSPVVVSRGLYALKRVEALSFEESISFTESQIGLLAMTEDSKEGLAAFREKRKPVWTGR